MEEGQGSRPASHQCQSRVMALPCLRLIWTASSGPWKISQSVPSFPTWKAKSEASANRWIFPLAPLPLVAAWTKGCKQSSTAHVQMCPIRCPSRHAAQVRVLTRGHLCSSNMPSGHLVLRMKWALRRWPVLSLALADDQLALK